MRFARRGRVVLAAALLGIGIAGSAAATPAPGSRVTVIPPSPRPAVTAAGARPIRKGRDDERPARSSRADAGLSTDNQRRIDVNQINMFVTNFGSFAYDLGTGNAGFIYPKGTNKTACFASGLWLGAQVGAETRVSIAEYSQEYGPGVILPSGAWDDSKKREYVVYKVNRYTGDPSDTAHVERTTAETSADPGLDPLAHHSWTEYMKGAAPYGAPTRTYRLPNTLTADPTDSVDVIGPDVQGDQMLWSVYNDANPGLHTNKHTGPLDVEVQQTTFAFNRQGALGSTLFLQFKIIHKGPDTLKAMYASVWADPDLGGFTDDLVGCDTVLSLGYCYNSTNNDQLYGITPPALGYDFFKGPFDKTTNRILPMTSFNKYINGTDPNNADEVYAYMQGLNKDGTDLVDPNGVTTKFIHAGDPVAGTGWLDSSPADRRMMLTAGPFTMAPGDTQTVVCAILIARGSDRLSSISGLKFFDTSAQDAFDRGFNLKSPPQQPKVSVDVDGGTVLLSWDAASRLNYFEPGYAFEGYNVYQGASVAGPWTRLATYDENNGIQVVRDTVFDVITGQIITDYPVAIGGDNGVAFTYQTSNDAVRGGTLKEGTEYYFAVTSYSYSATERDAILENAQQVIRVMPQRPASGTDPTTAGLSSLTQTRIDQTKPPSTDEIQVTTVDADAVKNECFRVFFTDLSAPYPIVGTDTVKVGWNLLNTTTGDTLLHDQINKSGDGDYRVFDGVQIKVVGAYTPNFQDGAYRNLNGANRRALEGVDFGLPFFGGGAGSGDDFFPSSLNTVDFPDSFTTVQIRFSHTETQKCYRYFREEFADGSRVGDGEYPFAGFKTCPFTVWDATNNVQLDAAFIERAVVSNTDSTLLAAQPATHDSTWGPDASDLGGREYLFVIRRPYSDTPKDAFRADRAIRNGMPLLYTLTAKLRASDDVIDDGDQFEFVWANPATPNDVYDFCTSPLVRNNTALMKDKLNEIRVVPNPYLNRSSYEQSQFNRIVRFIHMPETATVRIYNLAGQLVRTLQKTDPTNSVLQWNLLTTAGLPVASGVYIYHVESPGGSTFGRMVVFMEKERLNNF